MAEKSPVLRSGPAAEQRKGIRQWFDAKAVPFLMTKTGLPDEGVVQEIRYWHQRASNEWSTHPSPTAKARSFRYWSSKCQRPGCRKPLTKDEASYHHLKRGIPNQHRPESLLTYHHGCHYNEHGAVRASLRKGPPGRVALR